MSSYSDSYDPDPEVFDHATHYSYDVHGMVNKLVQDNQELSGIGQQYKIMEYEYDLVSGNTNAVYYQKGEADQYTYYYEYDADNKIIKAFTSRSDGILKDQDSRYLYYNHGPIARTEIGDLQVQGMDYAYTIQGWLKGVNSDMVDPTKDMGRDGDYTLGGNINVNFARDVFGYSLGYFEGDYYSINNISAGGNHYLANLSGSDLLAARNDLYNGNISHMVTSITQPGTTAVLPYGYAYQYDQLNRLVHMEGYNNLDLPSNSWKTGGYTGAYETSLTYDANGNILTLNRNGEAGNINMDNLTYQYDWVNNDPAQGLRSNKLYHVNDAITSTYTSDIDDQGTFTPASSVNDINALNNYGYDELGNLVRDDAEGIANIEWTVYGKIKSITRSASSTASNLFFRYDAQGKRIEKREIPYGGGSDKVTYYVYDASGNLMATYSHHVRDDDNNAYDGEEMFICNSHIIYGSSRIGVDGRQDTLVGHLIAPIPTGYHTRLLGSKQYENSNHLGNVLVTISDIKIPHDYNANSVVDYYTADIINAQDYYPFGSIMPGRNWSNDEYRFGFNGMEKDDEVKGNGNSLDFGARVYDSRLGRWLSLDPLMARYPFQSPYASFNNNPIVFIDVDGKEGLPSHIERAIAFAKSKGGMVIIDVKSEVVKVVYAKQQEVHSLPSTDGGMSTMEIVASHGVEYFEQTWFDWVKDKWNGANNWIKDLKGDDEWDFGIVINPTNPEDGVSNPDATKLSKDGKYIEVDQAFIEAISALDRNAQSRKFKETKQTVLKKLNDERNQTHTPNGRTIFDKVEEAKENNFDRPYEGAKKVDEMVEKLDEKRGVPSDPKTSGSRMVMEIDKDGNKTWTYGPKNYPSDRDTVIDNQKGQR